ncbi:MAG TPA: DUF6776 family protein [Steroidobacteraceae bacterium]|nr:DUF6776 family protein [Steroidobacteraceae bacterium]
MRTGQLVVRRRAPWRQRALIATGIVALILALYAAYEWGRFDGGYDRIESARVERETASRLKALEQENELLRAQVASVEVSRKIEAEAYREVERTLADLQAEVLRQDEELTFYRGIVSPEDGLKGLRIQRFEVAPGADERRYLLRLVLVQSLRQDKIVSGDVRIEFEGLREGQPATLPLGDAATLKRRDGRLAFSFRYFENLEQEVVLPAGFDPTAVNVEVRAARQDPIRQTFPWQVEVRG